MEILLGIAIVIIGVFISFLQYKRKKKIQKNSFWILVLSVVVACLVYVVLPLLEPVPATTEDVKNSERGVVTEIENLEKVVISNFEKIVENENFEEITQELFESDTAPEKDQAGMTKIVSEKDKNESFSLTNKGIRYLDAGNYSEAIKSFDKALSLYSQNASAIYKEGIAFDMLGDRPNAIKMYEQVVALSSDDVITLNNKGASLYALKRFQEAIDTYDKAIMLYPDNAIGYYDKGAIYSIENNSEKSLENLRKAIEIDERQKAKAKKDRDYNNVRHLSEFQDIIAGK